MNVFDFANRYLHDYKTNGNEIIPKYCPLCKGGSHHDKDTFALNTENSSYNCRRGKCGKSGTFKQLLQEMGIERMDNYELYKPKQNYKKPKTILKTATSETEKYLALRKISKSTMDMLKVGCDDKGNILFPYYENGILVMVKFRPARKVKKGDRKAWREEGGKPVLWGMDLCSPELPLIITEGEIDTLACYEAGLTNTVSVPSGAEDFTWVDSCWEWLNKFDKIILFGDNDEPGKEMVRKLILKLGEYRCYTVENKYKDANELLYYDGKEAVKSAIESAREVPVHGLIDLSTVTPVDIEKIPRVKSNIGALDRSIGGFFMGELSVWTGKRAEGKSTLLGQLLLEAINEGQKVCAYSGELRADRFQYWINLQAAGKWNISKYQDCIRQKEVSYVGKDVLDRIKAWYKGNFFLYDNDINSDNTEETGILKIFTYAVKRYDCKVFLIDNLMTAKFDYASDSNYYRAQSNFVGEMVSFAKKYNVHVHLVAHPRKGEIAGCDDVSGTGDITNRADNVFIVDRVKEEDRTTQGYDCAITIKKNRSDGVSNVRIGLNYCPISRRLYSPNIGDGKKYGWEKELQQVDIEGKFYDENGSELPF